MSVRASISGSCAVWEQAARSWARAGVTLEAQSASGEEAEVEDVEEFDGGAEVFIVAAVVAKPGAVPPAATLLSTDCCYFLRFRKRVRASQSREEK